MKVSIITPSYNQVQFLEQTIVSINHQTYTNIEHIIIDGGSSDNSIEIIKKYEEQVSYWVSEKDEGQVDAINKGFSKATGDIVCWLNSDDILEKDSVSKAVDLFLKNPNTNWLTGDCIFIDSKSKVVENRTAEIPTNNFEWLNLFVRGHSFRIFQPSTFWRSGIFKTVGYLNPSLNYSFDHEFFYRILRQYGAPTYLPEALSRFRLHASSKTVSQNEMFIKENKRIGKAFLADGSWPNQLYLRSVLLRQWLKL